MSLKVLFYHAHDVSIIDSDSYHLAVAALYLKTYIDVHNPEIANQLEWLVPQQNTLTDSDLIAECELQKVDLLCTSHYIWNHTKLIDQLARVRDKLPQYTKVIVGGPSINVNIDKEFFTKYPFIDYAVYGSGESAFNDVVTSIIKKQKLIAFNNSNLAWQDDQKKSRISEFKYVPQLNQSPYVSNKKLFSDMITQLGYPIEKIMIPYDLTRGCPYSCTFCDWNSGLSNKVSRRKNTYQSEIDLFEELGIKNIYLSDANVGQYSEDIDLMEYFAKKNIENNAGFKLIGNFSKLKKENNLKLFHIMAKANLVKNGFVISVQDINDDVLKNIDRPDVGWPEHRKMIIELRAQYPNFQTWIQLIQGMPGQTVKTWRETLETVTEFPVFLSIFVSELLPASPSALDPVYQDRFKFKYSHSERWDGFQYLRGTFPESCISFSKRDFVEMTTTSLVFSALSVLRTENRTFNKMIKFHKLADSIIQSDEINLWNENLYNNWCNHDKFYFTEKFGSPSELKIISACNPIAGGVVLATDENFLNLINKFCHSN